MREAICPTLNYRLPRPKLPDTGSDTREAFYLKPAEPDRLRVCVRVESAAGVSKSDVMDPGSSDVAARLALGEAQVRAR